jgi:methylosome protein 50
VTSICFVAERPTFITVGADSKLSAWDAGRATVASGTAPVVSVACAGEARALNAVAAHPSDSNVVGTCGDDGATRVWDLRHPKRPVRTREGEDVRAGVGRAYALAWGDALTGEALAVGYESGAVAVLETPNLETRGVVEAHAHCVRGLAWSASEPSRRLASCGDDGVVATHAGEAPVSKSSVRHGGEYARCASFWTDPSAGVAKIISGGWDGAVVAE